MRTSSLCIWTVWPLWFQSQQFAAPEDSNTLLSNGRCSPQRPLRQWQKYLINQEQAVQISQSQSSNKDTLVTAAFSCKLALESVYREWCWSPSLLVLQSDTRIIIAVNNKDTIHKAQTTSGAFSSAMSLLNFTWLDKMFYEARAHLLHRLFKAPKCLNSQIFTPKLFKYMMNSFQLLQWCLFMWSASEL